MTSDNPLISVIVPIYKVEAYLDRCVESIVNQTYRNLEIILVDDGSPDKCPEMCDQWAEKDPRIRVIHKQNGGLSDARNAGMDSAKGEYIAFIDSDDLVDIHYIAFLYQAIMEYDADISACEVCEFPDGEFAANTEAVMPEVQLATSKDAIGGLLKGCNFRAVAWNKLYRREVLENIRFEVGRLHEDEFFSFRVYDMAEKLTFIDVPLYYYRQRAASIMTTFTARHLDALDAFMERLEFLKNKYPDLYVRDKVWICIVCINSYCGLLKGHALSCDSKHRILDARKKLEFTWRELKTYSPKQWIYIIMSQRIFIDMFCRLRNWGWYHE